MAALGELVVSLSANTAKFTQGLDKAEYSAQKSFKSMADNAKVYGAALGGIAVAGVTAFAYSVKQAIDAADDMSKASQKIGVTTEALSALKYAADLSGISFESLQNGLKKLSVNMDEALSGTLMQVETFYRLGVSVTDASGKLKASDSVLAEIADKFQRMPDGVEKTAIAVQAFGKAGADLIPLLNGGSGGIEKMREEAEMLGIVLDQETARSAEKFNDQIAKLTTTYDGFALSTAETMLPALNSVVSALDNIFFGFDKLERQIKKTGGATAGSWSPVPSINDKPTEGMFKLPTEFQAAPKAAFADYQKQLKDAEDAAKASAKSAADAKKKSLDEQLKDLQEQMNFEIELLEFRNQEELDMLADREEEKKARIAETVSKQKEFNAEVERVKNSVDPLREYTVAIKQLGEMFDMGRITAEEFATASANAQKEMLGFTDKGKTGFDELKNAIDGFARDGASAMTDFIFGTKGSFSDMVNSMLKDLARLALQKSLFEPLVSGASDAFSSSSGGIAGLLGGMFGGGRAQGGDVQGGKSYLVGEYGPEVVTMGGNGTVTPSSNGSVTVSVNVDASGGSFESNTSFGKQLGNAIKTTVQSEMLRQKRQGGLLT